ncbi:hypothetical protein K3165_03740 [Qipengyuania sp. 1XM1-15A]|uniref:hypothetical protein n=1 Tax=Qipengyuania xiamenensis TaxID=2867237 RepID=UPI001C86813C|nr:hypothetical protein [Qipengyuania xiamenensis]MBX7532034.1 hypothetical protein [Qipengyuania xiamenensis]
MTRITKVGCSVFGLLVFGFLALLLIARTGIDIAEVRCDGTVKRVDNGSISEPLVARLGLRFEQFDDFVFWADQKQRFSFSLTYFEEDGSVGRWQDALIPLEEFNSTYASAGVSERLDSQDSNPALFYDNIAGMAQLVLPIGEAKLNFDGHCSEAEFAIK